MRLSTRLKFSPFYAVSYLPFRVLYALSDLTYFFVYYVLKYRREIVKSNLEASFPDKPKTDLLAIEKAFYRHFCDSFAETLKGLSMDERDFKSRMIVKNANVVEKLFASGKSAILYAGHYGNWEWISILPLTLSHQMTSFYQPLGNSYFNELMKIIRERFGIKCIESKKGFKSILEFERRNILTLNLMIGDQSPRRKSAKHWTSFLHQDTAFLVGAAKIAQKSHQAMVFPLVRKVKRGFYEIEFQLITTSTNELEEGAAIDKFAQLLENAIEEAPEFWLWSHKRWKLKKETAI